MTSLCKDCGQDNQWLPTPLHKIETLLSTLIDRDKGVDHHYELRKNLAYNLQYIEYLACTLEDLRLTSVLHNQTIKSFIIVGSGVVEAILYYVLRASLGVVVFSSAVLGFYNIVRSIWMTGDSP